MSSIPLRFTNNNVAISKITNSVTSTGPSITEANLEKLICYNLSQNILPKDLSDNLLVNTSLSLTKNITDYDGLMITNNNDLIDSETFAIKVNYQTNTNSSPNNVVNNYSLHSSFNQNITLIGSDTQPYMNSHLRIDLSYNNDLQNSIKSNTSNTGDWKLYVDRSDNANSKNYFAAINSQLNTSDGRNPIKISTLLNTPKIFRDGNYITGINVSTNKIDTDEFLLMNTLVDNKLQATMDSNYNYTSTDFTMYKLKQDVPTITQTIKDENNLIVNASNLPICNNESSDIITPTLTQFVNNVALNIGNNLDKIRDGYNINVVIGEQNGGFQLEDPNNNILNINTDSLNNSDSFLSAGISNDTVMYIDISNGSVSLEKTDISYSIYADYNVNRLQLSNNGETLESPYNATNGLIQIKVPIVTERTNILEISNNVWSNDIKVIYNCDEAQVGNVHCHIDASMTVNPVVNFNAKIVVPTTAGESYLYNNNVLNLKKSKNSALIVNSTDHEPNMINYQGIDFDSNIDLLYPDNNTIAYVTIKNENILTQDTPLLDNNDNPVPHSISTVKIQNIDLNESRYSDFQIKLKTKTITDLSNASFPANGWKIRCTNKITNDGELLYSMSTKNSILYDDCLFMRSGKDTSFNYTFNIVNPTVTNAQSIKHRIDISFSDISVDASGNPKLISNQAYLDDDDIIYTDVSYIETSSSDFTNYRVSPNNYGLDISNTKVKLIRNTISYRVSFDPKLPFYTNVNLYSPLIIEYVDSYKLYDKNDMILPDVYLKYLTHNNTSLSLVTVSQPNQYKTSLNVTPSNCSTLTAVLQGKNTLDIFEDVPNVKIMDQDPFFNTLTEFTAINGYNAKVSVVVQVNYPTELKSPFYIIDTVNAIGEKVSFTTELYKYNVLDKSGTNNSFDNFNAYNSSWVPSSNKITLKNKIELGVQNKVILTIYGENGTTVLATIEQPNTIIDDFNIIYCFNPLVRVITNVLDLFGNYVFNNVHTYSTAVLSGIDKREIFIEDGIYGYTDINPPRDSSISFSLKSDEVKVEFVSDSNYTNGGFNNGWNRFVSLTDVSGSNSSVGINNNNLFIKLNSGNNVALNNTKSVSFDKYRGYKRVSGGIDNINIIRKPSTAVFSFVGSNNNTYSQTFNNFSKNTTYTIDNAVYNESIVNLGLKFKGLISLLPLGTNTSRLVIKIIGASIKWTFSNVNNINNIYYDGSSNLTQSTFNNLFGWKSRNIYSSKYTINIKYNVPKIEVYKLDPLYNTPVSGKQLYGHPSLKTNWILDESYNLTTTDGFKISGLDILRTKDYVVNFFTSYVVIIPPQIKVEYNVSVSSTSFPFNQSSHATRNEYYITLVDPTEESYDVKGKFNLINNNINSLQNYNLLNDEEIEILGNYLNIYYYSDLSSNESNNVRRIVYEGTINGLANIHNNILNVNTSPSTTSLYDIYYKQFIAASDPDVNSNDKFNIHFKISDAFIGPPPNSIYFNLLASKTSNVSFYQSNIKLIDSSYILVIDKYDCNGIDYTDMLNSSTFDKLVFEVSKHYTSYYGFVGRNLYINDFPVNNMTLLFESIDKNLINLTEDVDFRTTKCGITISALSTQSIVNLKNLIQHKNQLFSSVSYINMPDIINVKSLFGPSAFRVTHSGNVKAPTVTSNVYKLFESVVH